MFKITSLSFIFIAIILSSCSTTKTIYVADAYADCESINKTKCLQTKDNYEDKWSLFYDSIEGFEYIEGYTQKIEIEITKVKNPPADASSLHYKLLKIIYKDKSKTIKTMRTFDGQWEISKLTGIDSLRIAPTLNIDSSTQKISGIAGCNKYSASYITDSNSVQFESPIATKMFCTNMNIEKAFFNSLKETSQYKFENNKLVLYSKDNKVQMTCNKIEK